MKLKIGDNVIVIAGQDKGQAGKIKTIFKKKNTVVVDGLNLKTKHLKSTNKEDPGKILNIEAPIHQSNIMLCDSDNVRSRFKTITQDGSKVRISKKTGQSIN
jgi:large subunit ribosomal protein L24